MERLASIQAMRGVAALLVVILHAREAVDRQSFIAHPLASPTSIGSLANIGAVGVDLFFVISGFVMALSAERLSGGRDAARFLLLRLIRIAPLFWLLSMPMAAWWLFKGASGVTLNALNSVTFVPLHSGPYAFPFHGVGWTLSFEFLFYGIVAALVCSSVPRRLPALAMLLLTLPLLPFQSHPWTLIRWLTNPMLVEFAFGVVAFLLWRADLLDRYRRAIVFAAACAVGILLVQHVAAPAAILTPNGVTHGGLGGYRALLAGLPCFALFLWALARRATAPARALGDASYSLYLIHPPTMIAMGFLLPRSTHGDVAFALLISISVAAALAIYHWLEKPMTAWLRALFEQHRMASQGSFG